jgi:hypothetical protein
MNLASVRFKDNTDCEECGERIFPIPKPDRFPYLLAVGGMLVVSLLAIFILVLSLGVLARVYGAYKSSPYHTSVQPCNLSQNPIAGFDEPVARRIELGQPAGTFSLHFEPVIKKDRIKVWYEGKLLYDSGCTGGKGLVHKQIQYSGSATIATIVVQPNCEGGLGTEWAFLVSCPVNTH